MKPGSSLVSPLQTLQSTTAPQPLWPEHCFQSLGLELIGETLFRASLTDLLSPHPFPASIHPSSGPVPHPQGGSDPQPLSHLASSVTQPVLSTP